MLLVPGTLAATTRAVTRLTCPLALHWLLACLYGGLSLRLGLNLCLGLCLRLGLYLPLSLCSDDDSFSLKDLKIKPDIKLKFFIDTQHHIL